MNRVQKLLANTDGDLPFKCYVNPSHLINILHDIIGKQFFLESEVKDYVIQWIKFDKFLNQFESEKERSKLNESYELIQKILIENTNVCIPTGDDYYSVT